MPPKRYSKFKKEWLLEPTYESWLEEHSTSPFHAACNICKTDFLVGSMRIGAVKSHREGTKHRSRSNLSAPTIKSFFNLPKPVNIIEAPQTSTNQSSSQTGSNTSIVSSSNTVSLLHDASPSAINPVPLTSESPRIAKSFVSEATLKAEIYWVLHVAVNLLDPMPMYPIYSELCFQIPKLPSKSPVPNRSCTNLSPSA